MPKPEKQAQPMGNPGVRVKDHVYFRHGADVRHGHVRACGEHGATINADGETHRVTWDRVMGHKKRAEIKVKVVDQGEDGAIVEDDKGNRFYLKSADEGDEKGEPMHKSMKAGAVVALFIKALPAAGETQEKGAKPEKPEKKAAGPDGFPHAHGAPVKFKAGTVQGKGKIIARGRDGATVEDAAKRRHQLHWHEIDKDSGEDEKP